VDAVTLLTKEHEEAKALFEKIEAAVDESTRRELLEKLITELRSHTKIEEEVLYPFLREQIKGGSKLFEESMQEHQEAKKAMKKLEEMELGDPEWQQTFEILMHGVLHHATEEERDMFPKLQEQASEAKLQELGEKMEADKTGKLVIDLPKEELLEQAQASDIEGRSTMDKRELEEALGHR
jgi:iron-sulfur cluster repair protein YtfE (RIC family)